MVATLGGPALVRAQQATAPAAGDAARLAALDAMVGRLEAAERDRAARLDTLAGAARLGAPGALVVLLRVEPGAARPVARATLSVDGAEAAARDYSAAGTSAPGPGAADELLRAPARPVPHVLALAATVGGERVSRDVTVTPARHGRPTYVEFVLSGSRLDAAAWTGPPTPAER